MRLRRFRQPGELVRQIDQWLKELGAAREMGRRAQEVVRRERGATGRHIAVILSQLSARNEEVTK